MLMSKKIEKLMDIASELDARYCSNNSIIEDLCEYGWEDLCEYAIQLLKEIQNG